MATKTITLKMEAYEKLKSAKRFPSESFSQIVLRATWPEETITAKAFLKLRRSGVEFFSNEDLDELDHMKQELPVPEDKWKSL